MNDIEWLAEILEDSTWLLYGEFEDYLNDFLKQIFQKEFKDFGFDQSLSNDFQVAYWSVLSEMVKLDLADYGTSPRGAWLTPNGDKFRLIILGSENAPGDAANFIHKKYNG